MNLSASRAKPLAGTLERWIRLHGGGALTPAYLGVMTTNGALCSNGPWNTASTLLPSGSSTKAP